MPETAKDISVGAENSVWIVGTAPLADGFGLSKWNPGTNSWVPQISTGAVQIEVGPDGKPWTLDNQDRIRRWNGSSWDLLSGTAKSIGVSLHGTPFIIGTSAVGGGYAIYESTTSEWVSLGGEGAVSIDVGSNDQPWIVNNQNAIKQWTGSSWTTRPGTARDVGVGADNSAWIIGTSATTGGYTVYRWNGSGWDPKPADGSRGGVQIDVAPDGKAWLVDDAHAIRFWDGAGWTIVNAGVTGDMVSVGANGSVWLVGTGSPGTDRTIRRWTGAGWPAVTTGSIISGGPNGTLGFLKASNSIWRR